METIKTKLCRRCGKEYPKTFEYFYWGNRTKGWLYSYCRKCSAIDSKKYRDKNLDKCRAISREYHREHKEQCRRNSDRWVKLNRKSVRANYKRWSDNNREKISENGRKYRENNIAKRKATKQLSSAKSNSTPKGLLSNRIRAGVKSSLRGKKNGMKWESLVGYTCDDLIQHLEKLFKDGMGWHNRDQWHVDHIIPIKAFNFTKPEHEDFKRCWALKNLRPMWAKENISKGAKLEKHFQPSLAF